MEKMSAGLRIIVFTSLFAVPSLAQQPFYTDDAEVSAKGSFRLELSNEFDLLGSQGLQFVDEFFRQRLAVLPAGRERRRLRHL